MDELATALKMDPLELRMRNYAAKEADTGKPFWNKHLREVLPAGRRTLRLGTLEPGTPVDARQRQARRLGRRDRDLPGASNGCVRPCAIAA